MTDSTAEATQADDRSQSQADTTHDPQDSPAETAQNETISLDEAKKLRSEAASLRKRLKEAEAKVQAALDSTKSEDDRRLAEYEAAIKRAEAAEAKLREASARAAVTEAATKANAISVKAVYALIKDSLEFDDDGTPTNVTELIAAAKRDEPSLFRAAAGSGDGGKRGPASDPNDINTLIRRKAGRA